jgi:cobalt-zinc-cadmium resistance protein CzcA
MKNKNRAIYPSKKNELAKYQEAITYYNEFGKKLSDEIIKVGSYKQGEIDFFQYIQSLENAHPFKLSTWITCFNLINPTRLTISKFLIH